MKTQDKTINDIVTALNSYSPIEAPEIVTATLQGMDDSSIGVLHGITGVFVHAVTGKPPMPAKWQKQIHEDLFEAFCYLSEIAHEDRTQN